MDERKELAVHFLASLLANPSRYDYIARLIESGDLTNDQATEKNISKAYKLADQF